MGIGMREKLIELLMDAMPPNYSDVFASQIAEHLIANDVVPVVRCKDCVHYRHGTSCVCDLHSEVPDMYGEGFDMQMLLNDFCSYGERRTEK